MDITDKERELIDTQEFHEHCMDYRGATPQTAHNHYQLMLNYVAKLLRSQLSSQWISASEKQPEENKSIYFVSDGQVYHGSFSETTDFDKPNVPLGDSYTSLVTYSAYNMGYDGDSAPIYGVTHWMYEIVPALPKD